MKPPSPNASTFSLNVGSDSVESSYFLNISYTIISKKVVASVSTAEGES